MELRKIQYFLRIVDEGSLSRAAQSLYLTQPTLSRFLEKLEEELEVALFVRGRNNSMTLTEAGESYLKTARKIDALCKELDADLSKQRVQGKELIFAVSGDHLLPFARQCAEKVMQQYPQLSVSYWCDSSPEIQRWVAEGTVRIGLCAYLEKDPLLSYAPCNKTEMDLVVSKKHPLAERQGQRICLQELPEDIGFAMMRGNTVLRMSVEDYLKRRHYIPNVKMTYQRHGSVVQAVGNSDLAGFCPASDVSEQLAYLPLDPPLYYCHGVCWLEKTSLQPAERLLINLLKKMPTQRILK